MAQPIPLDLPPRDPRAELRARLEAAPLDHAVALLEAYEVLQGLHDKGMLDTLRGAINSQEKILQKFTEAANAPESMRAMRNAVVLIRLFSAIDPESLKPGSKEPMSLLQLLKKLNSKDCRRALTAMTSALEDAGKAMGATDH